MGSAPPPILAAILRSTLNLVNYYSCSDAHGPMLDELTTALQRTIAAIEADEADGQSHPLRPIGPASRPPKGRKQMPLKVSK